MAKQTEEAQLSKVEQIKEESAGLRGPIGRELGDGSASFSEEAIQLLKHHGTYQQDDRDTRTERKKAGLDKDFKFMVRTKFPGGIITAEQYIACDNLASTYGQEDLRITSRQGFQFHGVLKNNLRALIHDLNHLADITTFGACGDVVRNVMGCPVADIDPQFAHIEADLLGVAKRISDHFLPKTRSYFDLWLNDEKVSMKEDGSVIYGNGQETQPVAEPIYGTHYLPRKFKIAITADFDNSVDVYANDVGVIAVTENGRLAGYEVLVGGGLGYTHRKPQTYARAATPLAFVDADGLLELIEAIVKVQRDFGGRADRRHARMKYLIDDIGEAAFRDRVFEYAGRTFEPPRRVEPTAQPDYLGWHKQRQDGLNYVGVWVENGRIRDFPGSFQFRTGLRRIVEQFRPSVRMTPHHNIILANIRDEDVDAVQAILEEHGIPTDKGISAIRRMEMACPALPFCGLALTEAERIFPDVIAGIEAAGHGDEDVVIRMSGCPNNCSRPRTAEIGLVGCGSDRYMLYVGGDRLGRRLCEPIAEKLTAANLAPAVSTLLELWKQERSDGERFGDWSLKKGTDALRPLVETFEAGSRYE